jgi:RNA polymerase sigma-70 factor (ECF subfamily)
VRLKAHPDQQCRLGFEDFRTALATLPLEQREALLLVGAQGMSYEEAAAVCQVAVGTVKSRVNRARSKLASVLDPTDEAELGPDDVTKTAPAAR